MAETFPLRVHRSPGRYPTRRTLSAGKGAWLTGYAADVGFGAPLKFVSGDESDGNPASAIAISDGDVWDAIFDGVEFVDASKSKRIQRFWPTGQAATDIRVGVIPTTGRQFRIQATGSLNAGCIGKFARFATITGYGAVGSNDSPAKLDHTTVSDAASVTAGEPAVTTYYPIKIVGLAEIPGNAWDRSGGPILIVEAAVASNLAD